MSTINEIIKTIDSAHYLSTSGINAYTATATPTLLAYVVGKPFWVKFNSTNTAAPTLNVDGLGAKTLLKGFNTAMAAGDIQAGALIEVVYDGANFQCIGGDVLFMTINQKINSAASNFSQTII